MLDQDTIHPGDDALTIGVKIHRQLEAQIKNGSRVLVLSVNSPGGPVNGIPSSVDGIPLRGNQSMNASTSEAIYGGCAGGGKPVLMIKTLMGGAIDGGRVAVLVDETSR